jgi:hypothetical protein
MHSYYFLYSKIVVLFFLSVLEVRALSEKSSATFIEPYSIDIGTPGKEILEFNTGGLIYQTPSLQFGFECALTKRLKIDAYVGLHYPSPIIRNLAAEASYSIMNQSNAIVVGALEIETILGDTNSIATELAIGYIPEFGAFSIPSKMYFGFDFTKTSAINIEPEFGMYAGPFYRFRNIQIGIPASLAIEDEKLTLFTGIETDFQLPYDIVFVLNINFPLLSQTGTPKMFMGCRFDF